MTDETTLDNADPNTVIGYLQAIDREEVGSVELTDGEMNFSTSDVAEAERFLGAVDLDTVNAAIEFESSVTVEYESTEPLIEEAEGDGGIVEIESTAADDFDEPSDDWGTYRADTLLAVQLLGRTTTNEIADLFGYTTEDSTYGTISARLSTLDRHGRIEAVDQVRGRSVYTLTSHGAGYIDDQYGDRDLFDSDRFQELYGDYNRIDREHFERTKEAGVKPNTKEEAVLLAIDYLDEATTQDIRDLFEYETSITSTCTALREKNQIRAVDFEDRMTVWTVRTVGIQTIERSGRSLTDHEDWEALDKELPPMVKTEAAPTTK